MYVSIFDLFKIGIGPSSSHTVGPMIAAYKFLSQNKGQLPNICSLTIELFGSLAYTYKGHGTDKAIMLGLSGQTPKDIEIENGKKIIDEILTTKEINLLSEHHKIFFDESSILINKDKNDYKYSNTMLFKAFNREGIELFQKCYFSIGGGFVLDGDSLNEVRVNETIIKYPYGSCKDLMNHCSKHNLKVYELIEKNEECLNHDESLDAYIDQVWKVMNKSIYNGMSNSGELEGGIGIRRRANGLYKKLIGRSEGYDPLYVIDWVNIFAIAVSEENAAFGKIVTAPTNGAAGIIPAVIKYYIEFCKDSDNSGIKRFLLTSSAVGSLFKMNASISGAEAGCQGEIGVACSMAAAGLTAALGGSNEHIENAAEIAMEHNLGLTCDPVNGLVQIPCIERNAMGAIKAINASRLALNGTGKQKVSLDEVIKTMWETGKNMNAIYKETSLGGLAVNVTEC